MAGNTHAHNAWRTRWEEGNTGWHRAEAHPALERWAARLPAPPARVFVPLCGKSRDLVWLHDRGYQVVGAELSARALRDFFSERGLRPEETAQGGLTCLRAARYELWCGDFFALPALPPFPAIYDRAALIALPRASRPGYAERLRGLLAPGGVMLLLSLDYPLPATGSWAVDEPGPPHSVPEEEIRALYAGLGFERLDRADVIDESPRFRERGLAHLYEQASLLAMPDVD